MDEASTLGTTYIAELKEDKTVDNYSFSPQDMGISPGIVDEIRTFDSGDAAALFYFGNGIRSGAGLLRSWAYCVAAVDKMTQNWIFIGILIKK